MEPAPSPRPVSGPVEPPRKSIRVSRLACGCALHLEDAVPWVMFCPLHAAAKTLFNACMSVRKCGHHEKGVPDCVDLACAAAAEVTR